jgi:ribosomal-protein-alanine N-acetyltransferase
VGGGENGEQEFGIYDIQVDPGYQNQGIGTNMIRRSLTILAEHEIPEFHLWREDDSRAQSLYQQLGFQPTGAVE